LLSEHGIRARAFANLLALAPELDESVGCLILVEEALRMEELDALQDALMRLPAWFDVPIIIIAADLAGLNQIVESAFPNSGKVTLLERPLNPHALASAVKVAFRASARQRQVGELLAQREAALKQRDDFVAMLAHELRNPLAPMRNVLFMMRSTRMENPVLSKGTDILDRQVTYLTRLVDDLLDIARLERQKIVLRRQRMDLNQAVASAVENCMQAAQERGHRIRVSLNDAALPIDADVVRIEQIICNLLTNAAKFSPQPCDIGVETAEEEGLARLLVRDPGIGFSPDSAERLFEPFMQVNPTLARSTGGLGLGLAIVRRLVELHGGSVRAFSQGEGRGATFVVRLPLASDSLRQTIEAQPVVEGHRRRRIVVVEDNPDVREALHMLLTMWGHEVAVAGDGRSGLERVIEERPEVALIDLGLPEMNGYDVARAIRQVIPGDGIRLIAVTGYGQPAERAEAIDAGFDGHLLKPVSPEILAHLLNQ
jgi:signal transduction histidine kinase